MDNAWFDEYDKYPNLGNETLPWLVGCAKQANIRESEVAFERFLPKNFKIINVTWVRARKPPYCIWRVEYNLDGLALLDEEGYELKNNFKMLESHHPANTKIINIHRSINAIVDYGVYCKSTAPNFELAVQSPEQLELGIHGHMKNLKIVVGERSKHVAESI